MKKVILTVSVVVIAAILAAVGLLFMGKVTGYVLDTSGSMSKYGFTVAKQAVLGNIKKTDRTSISYVIPFAENEGAIRRITYKDKPGFGSVESYMNRLTTSGKRTNLDEGVDAGILAVGGERYILRRTVILITDAESAPDPHHSMIQLDQLSKRVPRGIRFYVIDLTTDKSYPGYSRRRFGRFTGYTKPGTNLVVFSISSDMLKSLLSELTPSFPIPVQRVALFSALLGIVIIVSFIALISRHGAEGNDLFEGEEVDDNEDRDRPIGTVHIKVGSNVECRFGTPVTLTVGGSRRDDFRVKEAKVRELTVAISTEEQFFRQKQGLRRVSGPLFRSKSFTLSTGTPVVLRLRTDNQELHRYEGWTY